MTKEEIAHRKRMLKYAQNPKRPLSPLELAETIKELKKKYPQHFERKWPKRI